MKEPCLCVKMKARDFSETTSCFTGNDFLHFTQKDEAKLSVRTNKCIIIGRCSLVQLHTAINQNVSQWIDRSINQSKINRSLFVSDHQ